MTYKEKLDKGHPSLTFLKIVLTVIIIRSSLYRDGRYRTILWQKSAAPATCNLP